MEPIHQTRAAERATQGTEVRQENEVVHEAVTRGRGRGRGAGRGRGRGRAAAQNPPPAPVGQPQAQPELTNLLAALQQRLEAQEGVIQELRNDLQQRRAAPNVAAQGIPPPPPAAQPMPQPAANLIIAEPVRADLYEKFRRMRAPEFEGSSDPLVADEWLSGLQVIFDFMNLMDQEKVRCASFVLKKDARYWWETVTMRRNVNTMTWGEFVAEFNAKFFNMRAMSAQQRDFNNLK